MYIKIICILDKTYRIDHYSPSSFLLLKLSIYVMKWLRYKIVISPEKQVEITSQRNEWANTDSRIYRRWDQVPRRVGIPC
jgi:hypothetical protein